jgi:hypothetical protein
MNCENAYFNGWGSCVKLLENMNGAALQTKGNTWTDDTAVNALTWKTAIADVDSSVRDTLMIPIRSFENTTDDVEILTTQLGLKEIGGKPIPSGIIQLKGSINDYKQLHALENVSYEFVPFFQDGSYWLTRKSDGTLKGFRMRLGTKAGLPPEDKLQAFPLYLFFDNYAEFENVVVVTPDFVFSDLLDYSPAGLDVRIVTAYTGGNVVVKVTKRGSGLGKTGLVAGGFEVMNSNATPPVAVTAASDDGLGVYTLTIKKETVPVNLDASDWVILQAHDDDGTNLTYLSHAFKVVGGV